MFNKNIAIIFIVMSVAVVACHTARSSNRRRRACQLLASGQS